MQNGKFRKMKQMSYITYLEQNNISLTKFSLKILKSLLVGLGSIISTYVEPKENESEDDENFDIAC